MAAILPFCISPNTGGGAPRCRKTFCLERHALTTLLVTASVCLGRARLSLTPTARSAAARHRRIMLPLYTRPEWREDALWRCAGLPGGWLFMSPAPQLRLTTRQRDSLLYACRSP
ncbi:hypothetical protein M8494_28680 [Serratia ureilytica]